MNAARVYSKLEALWRSGVIPGFGTVHKPVVSFGAGPGNGRKFEVYPNMLSGTGCNATIVCEGLVFTGSIEAVLECMHHMLHGDMSVVIRSFTKARMIVRRRVRVFNVRKRALAFYMASHPRLGNRGPLSEASEILSQILTISVFDSANKN